MKIQKRVIVEIAAEIVQLEEVLGSAAASPAQRSAAAGRFFALYVQLPDAAAYAERAERIAREGAERVGQADPLYPKFRHYQAMAMRTLASPPEGVAGAQGVAAEMDRDAYARSIGRIPSDAMVFAAEWGDWAWERMRWDEAAEAYANANRAARAYASGLADEEARLKFWVENAHGSRAAFAYAKLGNGKDAILELERANGIHANRHETTWMLQRLRESHAEVGAQFDGAVLASKAFRNAQGGFLVDGAGQLTPEAVASQQAINKAVFAIRGVQGFASFGLPADWNDVAEAAEHGPLVYLVATHHGLAAVSVMKLAGGDLAVAVKTSDLRLEEIIDAARPYLEAEFGSLAGDKMKSLAVLLDWLDTHVIAQIDAVLLQPGIAHDVVFLQPVGLLSMLPLHLERADGQSGFAPGKLSYFYWVRGLMHSLAREQEGATGTSLVINNPLPLPVVFDPLELADFETQVVLKHIAGVELKGGDATSEAAMSELPKAALAHFCCHGTVDKRFFYSGILLLSYPEILMYKHLEAIAEVPARLVVLSACRSGAPALGLEQVLSLPAQFLSAGAAAVLGTLWHADEMATLLLMVRFYEGWCDEKVSPATALREAQRWLMSSTAAELQKVVPEGAMNSSAARHLKSCADDGLPYDHPWYWSAFFVAGA